MKTKILDTNILLDFPIQNILDSFSNEEDVKVVIPFKVLVELDTFKKGTDATNEYCRTAVRFLDGLRSLGNLSEGVLYKPNITVQVNLSPEDINLLDFSKTDINIIATARKLQESSSSVEIVTRDLHERVLADIMGIVSKDIDLDKAKSDELYTGVQTISINDEQVTELCSSWNSGSIYIPDGDFLTNEFVEMIDSCGNKHHGIYNSRTGKVDKLKVSYDAWGIKPKKDALGNVIPEQQMLMHLLLDPNIQFVSAIGASGCGKTLLALACGLDQALGKFPSLYDKVVFMRPMTGADKDLGALPGTKEEKLEPWVGAAFDNLEYLLSNYLPKDLSSGYSKDMISPMASSREKVYGLIQLGKLELEAITYLRGRSMPRQYVIVDDAQNLTAQQAATIITRAGEGSKFVFLGDCSRQQIDDKRLTPSSNGLAYTVDRLKGKDQAIGHITMKTVVRSHLADLGVKYL